LKSLVLIGGGGFSAEVAEVAIQNGFEVLGYVDIRKTESGLNYLGEPDVYLYSNDPPKFIFPAFGAIDRKGLLRRSSSLRNLSGFIIPSLISPHAYVSKSVIIGKGVFVSHGVVINPNTLLEDFSIINSGSIIGHDVKVSECSIVSGNVFVGGDSNIGANTLIGPSVSIMNSVNVGSEVIVSIGSVVGRNVPDGKTTLPILAKYV
tara:strand:- start:243 stop:857 length:615 start_codon:yes stop_codon:yes gene_type:complete